MTYGILKYDCSSKLFEFQQTKSALLKEK